MALRVKSKNSIELPSRLSPSLLLKSSVLQWLPCSEFIYSHNLNLRGVPQRHPWPFSSVHLYICLFLAEIVSSTTSSHPLCPSHPNPDITSSMKPFLNEVLSLATTVHGSPVGSNFQHFTATLLCICLCCLKTPVLMCINPDQGRHHLRTF